MSLAKRVLNNTLWLSVGEVTRLGLSTVIAILLARYLGDASYGKYIFAISFTQLFSFLADFGFLNYLVNEFSRDKTKIKTYLESALGLKLIISAFYFVFLVVAVYLADQTVEIRTIVYLAGITLAIESFIFLFYAIFRSMEKMQYEAIFRISLGVLGSLLMLGVIVLDLGLVMIFQANLIAHVVIFFLAGFFIIKKVTALRPGINIPLWKKMFKGVIPFVFSAFFMGISYYLDQTMLFFIKGEEITGWYGAVYKILMILLIVGTLYYQAIFPVISKLFLESKKELKKLLSSSFKIFVSLSIPIAIGGVILAKPLILFLFGPEFVNGAPALQILIWTIVAIFISQAYGATLLACMQRKVFMIGVGLGASINVIANLILIPQFSLQGAAWATLLSETTILVFMFIFFQKRIFSLSFLPSLIKPLIAAGVMGVVIFFLQDFQVLLVTAIGAIIYVLVLWLIKGFSKEEILLLIKRGNV